MMMAVRRKAPLFGLAALTLVLGGCAGGGLGTLGEVLGGVLTPAGGAGQQGQVRVEIQGVDTQRQTIDVRTEDGQSGSVLFDQNTVVVYRQEQYSPAALERGDIAVMQVQQIDQSRIYASRIDVEQSVQERSGETTDQRLQRVTGRIVQIDHNRGYFDLQTQQGTVTVFLPADAGPANVEYFRRLRTGSSVTVEGYLASGNRLELYRFL